MRHCFLRAALHTILAVLPEMRRRGEGRIANIASIGGQVSVPHLVPYSASKFALVGLSEGLRAELCHVGRTDGEGKHIRLVSVRVDRPG